MLELASIEFMLKESPQMHCTEVQKQTKTLTVLMSQLSHWKV